MERVRYMMRSTPESTAKFDDAFIKLQQKRGDGKVGMDIKAAKDLVAANPDSAHDFVIIQCVLAKTNTSHLQAAMVVAKLFGIVTGDEGLVREVRQVASSMGAAAVIDRIQVAAE